MGQSEAEGWEPTPTGHQRPGPVIQGPTATVGERLAEQLPEAEGCTLRRNLGSLFVSCKGPWPTAGENV